MTSGFKLLTTTVYAACINVCVCVCSPVEQEGSPSVV